MNTQLRRKLAMATAAISAVIGLSGIGPSALAQEAATVTGRVTNAQGQPEAALAQVRPIAGASVGLERDPGSRVMAGTTDERGVAQLRAPPPGRYRIYVDTGNMAGPVRLHISIPGSPPVVSQTIAPAAGGGRVYVSTMGRRASLFDIGRAAANGPVTIRVEAVNDAP